MSTRKLVLLIMLLTLAVPNRLGIVLAAPRRTVSDWKMPLPAGDYKVAQGDQDSCYDTHCKDYVYGNQNTYCAIDLWSSNIAGMPVLAPADGTVIDVGYQAVGGGNYVYILHDDGFVSHYEHLQKVYVERNTRLKQGQPFARVGATGSSDRRAWQEHLHFTVKTGRNGACVKLSSLDGNTDFKTNVTVKSSNVQVGALPDDLPVPIPPAPPVTPIPPPAPPSSPARPSLSNPINSASMAQSTNVTLSWNTSANATLYKVELWGGQYSGTMVPCDWQSGTSCHIGTMWAGTMSWHVKARNGSGQESDWSDTWTFTILGPTDTPTPTLTITPTLSVTPTPPPSAPAAPSLNNPPNGASLPRSTDVTLSWNAASNATQYKVELWGGPYSLMTPCDWQSGTSCHIGTMWAGTMSWHVKARNSSGQESNWSDTWSFTIQETGSTDTPIPPSPSLNAPSLSSPGNGSSHPQSTDITLQWNGVSGATQYKVELWGGPYSLMTPCDWQSGTSCHIGTMWPGVMQWHVKARNGSGQESDWSDTWTFTIQEAPPPFAGNIAPQAGRSPDGIGSGKAFDGDLSTFWTDGLGHGFTSPFPCPARSTSAAFLYGIARKTRRITTRSMP